MHRFATDKGAQISHGFTLCWAMAIATYPCALNLAVRTTGSLVVVWAVPQGSVFVFAEPGLSPMCGGSWVSCVTGFGRRRKYRTLLLQALVCLPCGVSADTKKMEVVCVM